MPTRSPASQASKNRAPSSRSRVPPGTLASQCLELGLVDEIWIDLVPVLLGSGVRFFDELKAAPILLDGPDLIVEGSRVTHLRYQVRRS